MGKSRDNEFKIETQETINENFIENVNLIRPLQRREARKRESIWKVPYGKKR